MAHQGQGTTFDGRGGVGDAEEGGEVGEVLAVGAEGGGLAAGEEGGEQVDLNRSWRG
jgi:hypothetical protein